ncbi:MAG TPA: cyanophycinase [Pantanalinema sp.]
MHPAAILACSLCLILVGIPSLAAEDSPAAFRGGPFVLIGGGADQDTIARRILHLAGADKARLVIVPSASGTPEASGKAYQAYFKQLGARDVQVVIPVDEPTASQAAAFHQATGFFFSGGDQSRILARLGKPAWLGALQGAWRRGAVVAGTSAGAMVWGDHAILGDGPEAASATVGAGFGLLPDIVVDTHFSERGRFGRLVDATVLHAPALGIGIDPGTALILTSDGKAEVIGKGTVTLARPMGRATHSRPLSVPDLRARILAPGEHADVLEDPAFEGDRTQPLSP